MAKNAIGKSEKGAVPLLILAVVIGILGFAIVSSTAGFKSGLFSKLFVKPASQAASGAISNISDNLATFPNSQVPKYEKYEVSFSVATNAQNIQFPYDTSPPPGITAGIGVTVNGEFTQDNFQTVLKVPAFYYQDFDYQFKSNRDWIYPTNNYAWKIRFAPPKSGNWQYRITSQDGSGTSTSGVVTFPVVDSVNKGFIRNAKNDPRYFEFDNGSNFVGLGYNMNFSQISWNNPIVGNAANFQAMNQNGIQFVRMWLSQWGIFGSSQNPWTSMTLGPDNPSIRNNVAAPGSEVSMEMEQYWNPCMFLGWQKQAPAVKANTKYKISIRYAMPQNMLPLDATKPYGLVAKTGGWLQPPDNPYCYTSGVGTVVSNYATTSTKDAGNNLQWQTLTGSLTTGAIDFMPNFYLVLENMDQSVRTTTGAQVFIDRVDIQEDLGGGNLGVNIVSKPWMAHHQYFEQRDSYAFDKVLDLAKANNIYLKVVGLEKNEWILNHFDLNGSPVADQGCCYSNNQYFYGNYGEQTKSLWLEEAWWRYMQARWGYSTNVQSWELLNEGDPNNSRHYWLAETFGKFMKQFANAHLISTSFWDSFPLAQFWANASFPHIDYADIHAYVSTTVNGVIGGSPNPEFIDPASATGDYGYLIGAKGLYGAGKPTLRGETAFVIGNDTGAPASFVSTTTGQSDTAGIWLHKFIWGLINSSGFYEPSWWYTTQIYGPSFDHRNEFGNYYNFIKDVPLNNGNYKEASASANNVNVRVWGQKDTVNKRAHLWVDNIKHTWKNVVDNVAIPSVSTAQITLPGMSQGSYPVVWFNTYNATTVKTETVQADGTGNLVLNLPQALGTDIAVKIGDYTVSATAVPSATSAPTAPAKVGDINNSGKVDIFDYNLLITDYGVTSGVGLRSDLNHSGKVDILDYNLLITNYGR